MNYGLLNNPILNIGAGLLAAGQSPGGTLGMGLQQGLQNAMRGQQFATQQKLMKLKMDEIQRQQKERERQQSLWNNYIGQPAQYKPIAPGSDEEFANFGNLAAVDETGGLLQTQQATGINKYDPGMAQTLGLLGPEKGADFVSQLALQNAKPTEMTNIEKMLISAGIQPGTQQWNDSIMQYALKPQTQVNVGGGPLKPPTDFMWVNPDNPAASDYEVKPIPRGPADPRQSTASENMKKYKEGQAKLGQVRQSLTTYRDKLRKFGGEFMPGQNKTDLATSYRDLQLELKELYNLGVLNGPDLMLMEQVLTNPTSLGGALEQGVYSMFGGDPLGKQLETIFNKLTEAEKRNRDLYGPDRSRFSEDVK